MSDRTFMYHTRRTRRLCGGRLDFRRTTALQITVSIATGTRTDIGRPIWVGGGIVYDVPKIFQRTQSDTRNLFFTQRECMNFVL